MQNSNLPNQSNSNFKQYYGPPLPASTADSGRFINDIDYQLVTDFRDDLPQPGDVAQVGEEQTQSVPAPSQVASAPVDQTQVAQSPLQNVPIPAQATPTQDDTTPTDQSQSPQAAPQVQGPVSTQAVPIDSVVTYYQPGGEQKIEFNPNSSPIRTIQDLLSLAIEKGASDLHISVGYPPLLRINGDLVPVPSQGLSDDQVMSLFAEILQEKQKQQLKNYLDIDFSYTHQSGNRFRINIFYKQGQLAGAFRLIPSQIRTITDLGMPPILQDFTNVANGLVLVTGPTGSGKSTTIASVIQEINITQPRHILTIEDPIEYIFPRAKALVNQREIGRDVRSWTRGLREILREDPDVVLVGEMRDYETIAHTITAAETGHLVFSTLHTNSASQTIDRIIDVFPDVAQAQIRAQLANVIHAVVSQRLVPVKSGGRRAVCEIMVATPAIRNAIREKKTYQIDNMIQTGAELGMVSLEKSLANLIRAGEITLEEAQAYTVKNNDLISLLKQN